MGLLLDTTVISELTRPTPEPRVVAFVSDAKHGLLSIITLHEMNFGILRLPNGVKQTALLQKTSQLLHMFSDQLLPVDQTIAHVASQMRAQKEKAGRHLVLADALIAATAHVHNLTLATRNTQDVDGLGVTVINPWPA
jgi:toxin FitB